MINSCSMARCSPCVATAAPKLPGRGVPHDEQRRCGRACTDRAAPGFFFDLLHVDRRDLLDAPLSERLELMGQLLPETVTVPREVCTTPERLQTHSPMRSDAATRAL